MNGNLKTLKELTGMIGMLPLKSDILDINVVKQEAIKWVKEFRKHPTNSLGEIEFMEFHNITEEDLK